MSLSPAFDYLIIGGGTAGCIVASNLVANDRDSVFLIEAGGNADKWTVKIPGALRSHFNPTSKTNWFYQSEPQSQLAGRKITLHSGCLYGGSSSINGMMFVLPTPHDLMRWKQASNINGWSWEDIQPFVNKVSDHIPINFNRYSNELSEKFLQSSMSLGHPYIPNINDTFNERFGVFHYPVNIQAGTRWASYKGYLQPSLKKIVIYTPNQTL